MGNKSAKPKGDPKTETKTTDAPKKTGKSEAGKGKGKEDKKPKVLQMLVAGAAQSGKSTFFKQLQIIHLNGFSTEQKGRSDEDVKVKYDLGVQGARGVP